jgi:hypothetical protein
VYACVCARVSHHAIFQHDYNDRRDEKTSLLDDDTRRHDEMMDEQIDTQSAFIEEREEGIKALESTMLEVNDVFRDLSTIIHEQGQMLDSIEAHVTVAASSVESGTEQLGTASRYQVRPAIRHCQCASVVSQCATHPAEKGTQQGHVPAGDCGDCGGNPHARPCDEAEEVEPTHTHTHTHTHCHALALSPLSWMRSPVFLPFLVPRHLQRPRKLFINRSARCGR